MTDANELDETIMREMSNVVVSDTGETTEEQESFSFYKETVSDDIPPSLLSYFETSKSRAAVCEMFILEELEDFTASHHTEDTMNQATEFSKDIMELNKQVTCETENEDNNFSTDTHLLPPPTETEALFTHNVSVCPNNEDETGTNEYMGSEKYLEIEVRTLKSSMNEEEIKKSSEYQREHREKQHCEEMKKEEQRRHRERDFQEELKKIMEAEKLRQKEFELMEKRAQEKLEQEFLLQQELISNLQKRVEEERRMREEEQKRIKEERERKRKEEEEKRKREEEDRRKREEERIKRERERKRMEEEEKRNREEEDKRKREEEAIKREMERKRMEEEKRRKEEEEKRKIEEMRLEEQRRKKEEEQRKKEKEEKKRRKREEDNKKIEEEMRKKEEERKVKEIQFKEEEKRRQVEEEERKRKENEEKIKERDTNRKRVEEEETRKREKMIEVARKKMEKDKRRKNEEEMGLEEEGRNGDEEDDREEEEVRITKELELRMKQKEMRKEEKRKSEEETRKAEIEKKIMAEQTKRKEEENRELQLKEDEEKRKKDEERRHSIECKDTVMMEEEKKTKEECGKWQKKEMTGQKEEEHSNVQEEIRLKKMKEKRQEEVKRQQEKDDMTKREDGRRNIEPDKKQIKEDMRKSKENIKAEERRLKEEEESNKIIVQDTEKEDRLMRANELQEKEKENDSMKAQNKSKNMENNRNSLTSQLEDSTTLASSSPGPSHSESTVIPTSSETVQQHDLNKDVSQTSIYKAMDLQDAAVKPCTSFSSLPVCLPEHTEQKRLSWMRDCISWSKLSLQNKRKQKGCIQSRRGLKRAAEASSLPPLCPHTLLQSIGCKSLQEVTTVTLEDLPGCSLSTLAQCTRLQSLTLIRCGLKSLEGVSQLPQLCYIDVQENDISFVDCENMTSLRVLRLGHNKLTSIHGLSGVENLNVLDLSYNSITRIAGLEFMRRLQRLSVDHNQLISTRGLRDVYTLLHLDCSNNHLASVEGLENSALLQTLDLRANSLTEPPSLNNHILLRELHLDDNSISSLQGLIACWLPLMHHFSVAQNRITLLPSMSDFVSLANLDLRFNCISELQNVCESLEGCQFLREVHLTGNPLQQESGWRSTLQKAVAGLRTIDGQETDSFQSAPAVQQVSLASGGFLTFCQAQLKQTCDLQLQHSRELSNASSHLDVVRSSCRHFAETLKLAEEQRFAQEYGDTSVSAGQTTPEKALERDRASTEKLAEHSETESTETVPPVIPSRNNISCSYGTLETAESWHDTLNTVTTVLNPSLHSFATKGKSSSSHLDLAPVSNHQALDLKNTAAVVIQQRWRKYRQKCGNISSPPTAERGGERGGDEGKPESGPSYINGSAIDRDYAATIIQAFWRGFAVRRRLASALAAVTCPDSGEDETFEEVDMDEFVFDEAALEKHWTLLLSADSPPRHHLVSEQAPSLKPPGLFPKPPQYTLPPPPSWRPKQAWMAGEQVDPAGQRISLESRGKSPASTSVLSGVSSRSEKILEEWGFTDSHTALLMLKRAQKMKSKKQQQKKLRDPSVRLALFRNCNYQRGPVEARNRPAPHNRNYMKVCEAELGLQQAEKTEQVKQEQAQQWLHTQSDRDSESEHFLPEISSDILNGGRVQLVADPGYTERLHHASGLWANSSLAAQPCKERHYPRRNSLGHARKELPSPKRVTSAPSKKERISFRDNPVQLSGGWGGGKKRDKVHK